jgi:hypothetical protein
VDVKEDADEKGSSGSYQGAGLNAWANECVIFFRALLWEFIIFIIC